MVRIHVKPIAYPLGNGTYHSTSFRVYSQLFPILCCVCGVLSLVAGYVIAVLNDHEEAWFSMISEGGALPPESCIFGILLNFSSFFWILTCFSLHYHLLDHLYWHRGAKSKIRFLFYIMLLVGIISGIGISVVADFQLSNLRAVHNYGAMMGFIAGLLYCWCYVVICVNLGRKWIPRWLMAIRVLLVIFMTACLTMYTLCYHFPIFVNRLADGTMPTRPARPPTGIIRLEPCDPYYNNYIVVCVSEWLLAGAYFIMIASMACELSQFDLRTMISERNMEDSSVEQDTTVYHTKL